MSAAIVVYCCCCCYKVIGGGASGCCSYWCGAGVEIVLCMLADVIVCHCKFHPQLKFRLYALGSNINLVTNDQSQRLNVVRVCVCACTLCDGGGSSTDQDAMSVSFVQEISKMPHEMSFQGRKRRRLTEATERC